MLAIAYGGQAVTTRVRGVARIAPRLQQAGVVIGFALFLLPVRHADRGVADRILPQRPDRPLIQWTDATLARRIRRDRHSFARGLILPVFCGVARRATETPFTVAATQATAPDFVGLGNWFNSAPLKLADLRGKVVLVNFWTYGCVNCVNTLPHVTGLYAKYRTRGRRRRHSHPGIPFERSAQRPERR